VEESSGYPCVQERSSDPANIVLFHRLAFFCKLVERVIAAELRGDLEDNSLLLVILLLVII